MHDTIRHLNISYSPPHLLWFITLSYTMTMVLSNWFDARLIHFFGLDTDAGTLIFPLTFLLSDVITEVYGYKHARRAIWCGFLFNALFILYGQIVIHMPSPDYATHNALFDTLLAINIRIIVASAISYICAEPLNSYLMAKLKIKLQGKYMGLRLLSSTVIAAGIDSFIFSLIAFYGAMTNQNLGIFALTMWFIKIVVELVGLPISIRVVRRLKMKEELDVYDTRTRFNFFSLDVEYTERDNGFSKIK